MKSLLTVLLMGGMLGCANPKPMTIREQREAAMLPIPPDRSAALPEYYDHKLAAILCSGGQGPVLAELVRDPSEQLREAYGPVWDSCTAEQRTQLNREWEQQKASNERWSNYYP